MVSELAPEVDRGKHHSVYRGERDRVDAYACPHWWCCSPHQLTLLLPLFNHQFSGASNQLRIKHLSSGLRATIYQQVVVPQLLAVSAAACLTLYTAVKIIVGCYY